ncbi:UNVERIFIED_CONTAM: bifunctional lysylphosphatidylglycerol flippase/synthetase MprF [Streptococcus canis]
MNKVITFIKKRETFIKLIFFLSVSILVVNEFSHILKTISIKDVLSNFNQLSPFAIAIMLVLGLIGVLPMLFYDIILNKELNTHYPLPYILETSWVINSFNNIIGFAGLVDIGLRYSFYSEEKNSELSLKKITNVLPYFGTGFSLFSFLALMTLLVSQQDRHLLNYWPILVIISLYLPIVLLLSYYKIAIFGQLKTSSLFTLLVASFGDWLTVVGGFIVIGILMGLKVHIVAILPLVVIGHAVGMASMIPGGVGSFDLVMLAGLVSLGGIQRAEALAWLLMFRICYYIIPFAIGVVFFIKHMGSHLAKRYYGIPDKIIKLFLEQIQLFLIRLFGFFLILSALIPDKIHAIPLLNDINPVRAQVLWQYPSIVLGGLFIILARLLANRLRIALPISYFLFAITILYINLAKLALFSSVFLLLCFSLILLKRNQLNRRVFTYSWENITKDGFLFITTVLILIALIGKSLTLSLKHIQISKLEDYLDIWIQIALLATIALLIYKGIIWLASRQKTSLGEAFDHERFTTLIKAYGPTSGAGLAFLGDKQLYWYQNDSVDAVVLQFSIYQNKCVVMGDPIGNKSFYRSALTAFVKACQEDNMSAIFYEISQETTLILHELGFDFIKFGESARVDLKAFSLEGKKGNKYRSMINKLENKGYSFDVYQAPHKTELLDQLEVISNSWLDGRKEKGFSLGFFNRDYLQLAPIAVVKNADGQILAFANFLPINNQEVATIDLMRYHLQQAPNGIMHYLFIKLFEHFKAEKVAYFELGMAPLANVGNLENSFIQEKIAYFIYLFSKRFYSFEGLHQYKQKFHPIWTSRYISYSKHNWLLYDMISIYKLGTQPVEKK